MPPANHARCLFEDFHRPPIDLHAPLRTRVDKSFACLIVARGAHKTRSSRELVAGAQSVATSPLDPVGHPRPFFKPSRVVAYLAGKRAAHAIDFIDLDTRPRRAGHPALHPPASLCGRLNFRCP